MDLIPPALAAALISGLTAFLIARIQIKIKLREIDNFHAELAARFEDSRQAQILEILKIRASAYPELWAILVEYTINWPYRRAARNEGWALEFLEKIDLWNAKDGLFLSEPSYDKFKSFRKRLYEIARNLSREGSVVASSDYGDLYRLFIGDRKRQVTGLATTLKNDLGSYLAAAAQADYDGPIRDRGTWALNKKPAEYRGTGDH